MIFKLQDNQTGIMSLVLVSVHIHCPPIQRARPQIEIIIVLTGPIWAFKRILNFTEILEGHTTEKEGQHII